MPERDAATAVSPFRIRQCQNEACRFRFPVPQHESRGKICSHCGAATRLVAARYKPHAPTKRDPRRQRPSLEVLLDNIRSSYNVGSIFRTADGAGVGHLHLGGITPPPHHPKVAKTALGAEKAIPWTRHRNGVDAALALQQQGKRLWAIEGSASAEALFDVPLKRMASPVVLVVGNEQAGIDPHILAQCERVLAIPMQGVKGSLNVAVAFGIAVYHVVRCLAPGGSGKVPGTYS